MQITLAINKISPLFALKTQLNQVTANYCTGSVYRGKWTEHVTRHSPVCTVVSGTSVQAIYVQARNYCIVQLPVDSITLHAWTI